MLKKIIPLLLTLVLISACYPQPRQDVYIPETRYNQPNVVHHYHDVSTRKKYYREHKSKKVIVVKKYYISRKNTFRKSRK